MRIGNLYTYDVIEVDPELSSNYDARTLEVYLKRIKFQKDADAETQKQNVKIENDRSTADYNKSVDSQLDDKKLLQKFEVEAAGQRKRIDDALAEEASKKPQVPVKEMLNRSSTINTATKIAGEVYKI